MLSYKMMDKELGQKIRIFSYIFLISLALRLLLGLKFGHILAEDKALIIARNLAAGKGYTLNGLQPSAILAPGFSLILSGLIFIFGDITIPIIFLRAIIGGINAYLCAWLGTKIFGRPTGIVAGILYAFIPFLAQKEAATELPFATLGVMAGLCFLWKSRNYKNFIWIAASGLMFSFAYLFRPDIGILPFFITVCILLVAKQAKHSWQFSSAIMFLFVFLVGISPWAIRNKLTFGRWYLGQTFFWQNVYIANHESTFKVYPEVTLDSSYSQIKTKPPAFEDEFKRENWFRQQALKQIDKLGPSNIAKYIFRKFIYLWGVRLVPFKKHLNSDIRDHKRTLNENLTFSVPYIFLILFALFATFKERKRWGLILFTLGFLFTFSLPYITVFVAYSRYTTMVYFVLIIFSARGLILSRQDLNHLTRKNK